MHILSDSDTRYVFRADEESFGGLWRDGWRVLNDYPSDLPDVIPAVPLLPKRYRKCKQLLNAPDGPFYV